MASTLNMSLQFRPEHWANWYPTRFQVEHQLRAMSPQTRPSHAEHGSEERPPTAKRLVQRLRWRLGLAPCSM